MKRLISILLIITMLGLLQATDTVGASGELLTEETLMEYHLLKAPGFESEETVTRFEAVTILVKAIGATWSNVENIQLLGGKSGSYLDMDWMCTDGDLFGRDTESGEVVWMNYDGKRTKHDIDKYNKLNFDTRYRTLALCYGIAQGERYWDRRYFYHDRPVTATESAIFMTRCLIGQEGIRELGFEGIMKLAEKSGIIKKTDGFYQRMDDPITPDEYCTMLLRLLSQKRCLYFDPDSSVYIEEDTERSMTYLEYLQDLRKAKLFPEENPYGIDKVSVFCNGLDLVFDAPPIKEDDRVLVPMRKIFEVLGASVEWSEETSTITAKKDKTEISLTIGSNIMLKNGKKLELDVPAKVMHDRTLVPIRAVSEGLGARLEWDEENQAVWIWAEFSSIEPVVVEFEISEDDFPKDGNGSSVSVASFIPGDYIQLGQYANVPIVWRFVGIDENGMLLLSDRTLCDKRFGLSNFWAESALRKWLNSDVPEGKENWIRFKEGDRAFDWRGKEYNSEKGFLHPDNFTHSERALMKTVTQWTMLPKDHLDLAENGETEAYNPVKDWVSGEGSNEPKDPTYYDVSELPDVFTGAAHRVEDTVFLLDEMQLHCLWSNAGREKLALCAYCRPEGYIRPPSDSWYDYYLRTPSIDGLCSNISFSGYYGQRSWLITSGVRPAFYLNEAAAQVLFGSGTYKDPYIIDGISIYCDEEELSFDVPPIKEDDRVIVPMRKIFEVLGASVDWTEETSTVTARKDKTEISLTIGSNIMLKNGKKIELDVPAKVMHDRTLVPIRAVSEGLGARVEWDEENQAVWIWTD